MKLSATIKRISFGIAALCLSLPVQSSPRVSLITCGAGEDLYSIFGHTALRIADSAERYDVVYNYGMFSYNTDNFLYKFVKGETYYWLGAEQYDDFIGDYRRDGRAVYESRLLIDDADAVRIRDFMANNIRPENKVYLYSYMFDNCATRIRDLVSQSVGDTVIWQPASKSAQPMPAGIARPQFFDSLRAGTPYTYRDLLNLYLHKIPWVEWGIYYSVAAPSDRLIPYNDAMFLPEFLLMGFQNAVYVKDGKTADLVGAPIQVLAPQSVVAGRTSMCSPMMVFVLLLIAIAGISHFGWRKGRVFWGIDAALLVVLGLYGVAGFFVSVISIHPATFPNYNLLWASPLHLLAGIFMFVPYLRRRARAGAGYFFLSLLGLYLVAAVLQLQALHWANIPLMAVFAIRYLLWIQHKTELNG